MPPSVQQLLGLRCVEQRARREGKERLVAFQELLKDCIRDGFDPQTGEALRIWFQLSQTRRGQFRGARRTDAGKQLTSAAKSEGVSGRTWERRYEMPAVGQLAVALFDLEVAARTTLKPLVAVTPTGPPILAITHFRHRPDIELDPIVLEGFTEEIVARLARLENLALASPTATETWESSNGLLAAARDNAGADYLLTGIVDRHKEVLHLSVRLDNARTERTLWAESFTFATENLLPAQKRVAEALVQALGLDVSVAEKQHLISPQTSDPAAYELYLRALGLTARNSEVDFSVAEGLVEAALVRDGQLASAHALKGYILWRRYFSGWGGTRQSLDQGLACAEHALTLDPVSASARLTKIRIAWDIGQHEDALHEGYTAFREAPHSSTAMIAMARALNNAGLADLSLILTRCVLQREPTNLIARKLLIWNYLMTGEYQQACDQGDIFLELHPEDANTAWAVTAAHFCRGEHDNAVETCARALRHEHRDVTLWTLLGYVFRSKGDAGSAESAWREGIQAVRPELEEAPSNHRVRVWLANMLAGVGDVSATKREVNIVIAADPANGYLAFRLSAAYAELGDKRSALEQLGTAINSGFLSVQILCLEERLALSTLSTSELFSARKTALEDKVETLRSYYAERLPREAGIEQ